MIPRKQNVLLDPTVQSVQLWNWYFSFSFCQVSSWGGYVFLINLIPLHVLVLMLTGRFSHRIYVAYCTVYCLGTILSMQISFVGFQVRPSSTASLSGNLGSSIFHEGNALTSTHLHTVGSVSLSREAVASLSPLLSWNGEYRFRGLGNFSWTRAYTKEGSQSSFFMFIPIRIKADVKFVMSTGREWLPMTSAGHDFSTDFAEVFLE